MKEILTVVEVADLLAVHPGTVRRWLRDGELTGCFTPAGWRVTPQDIERWLAKYRRGGKDNEPNPSD